MYAFSVVDFKYIKDVLVKEFYSRVLDERLVSIPIVIIVIKYHFLGLNELSIRLLIYVILSNKNIK